MTTCKVCDSDKRKYIEQLILQGNSNYEIANQIKAIGIDISHASINRHKEKHMLENLDVIQNLAKEKGNRKYNKDDSKNEFSIDGLAIIDEIENSITNKEYEKSAKTFIATSLMLHKIAKNQSAIVLSLQEKYMKGECKYPHEQITGLDRIQSLIIKQESFQNRAYEYMKEIEDKRDGLFNYENRHLDSELEIKTWIQDRPYIKGFIFNLLKHYNYDFDETICALSRIFDPDTVRYVNLDKYRNNEFIEDKRICSLLQHNYETLGIDKIIVLNELLINGNYETVLNELESE